MRAIVVFSVVAVTACGGGQPVCNDVNQGSTFCVPDSGSAPAGQALTLQIVDNCLGACAKATLSCTATVDAGTINLAITGQVCTPATPVACTADCAIQAMDCAVPALAAGDYTVTSASQPSRTLHVSAGAGAASCKAPLF